MFGFHILEVWANKHTSSHGHRTLQSEHVLGNRQKVGFLEIDTRIKQIDFQNSFLTEAQWRIF